MEWIAAKLGVEAIQWTIGSVSVVAVAWILKKIPNNVIKAKMGVFMYGLGVTCTLGLAKWKWTKGIWTKTLEPWVVDAIDNIIANGINEFVRGLRSDN